MQEYTKPAVADLGAIMEMTQMLVFQGAEDGGSKQLEAHHSMPLLP